mmetsp:Transcript_13249/g.25207  ORF Transcript_13249/g.25207 Transcript_13249/m.25207 type:complete len:207 (-) Transcript_13249:41-661(-)
MGSAGNCTIDPVGSPIMLTIVPMSSVKSKVSFFSGIGIMYWCVQTSLLSPPVSCLKKELLVALSLGLLLCENISLTTWVDKLKWTYFLSVLSRIESPYHTTSFTDDDDVNTAASFESKTCSCSTCSPPLPLLFPLPPDDANSAPLPTSRNTSLSFFCSPGASEVLQTARRFLHPTLHRSCARKKTPFSAFTFTRVTFCSLSHSLTT